MKLCFIFILDFYRFIYTPFKTFSKTIGYAIIQLPEIMGSIYTTIRKIFLRKLSVASSHSPTSPSPQKIIDSGKQDERRLGEHENKNFGVNSVQLMEESHAVGNNQVEKQIQSIVDRIEQHDLQFGFHLFDNMTSSDRI